MTTKPGRRRPLLLCILLGVLLLLGLGLWRHPGVLYRLLPLPGDIPEELLALREKNPETADFVAHYPELRQRSYNAGDIDLSGDIPETGTPHFLQWDERWGCASYGRSILALSGCGPTSLSMVSVALTGDETVNPLAVAEYSQSQGWYIPGSGTSWELMRAGAEHFGLAWQELPLDEYTMRSAIAEGRLLILSLFPGDFTDSGHYVVLDGCCEEGFSVLDPNSRVRSRVWDYETLKGQIGNLWAYSAK